MIVKYFVEAGSTKHGRMPYYQVLNKVLENGEIFTALGSEFYCRRAES